MKQLRTLDVIKKKGQAKVLRFLALTVVVVASAAADTLPFRDLDFQVSASWNVANPYDDFNGVLSFPLDFGPQIPTGERLTGWSITRVSVDRTSAVCGHPGRSVVFDGCTPVNSLMRPLVLPEMPNVGDGITAPNDQAAVGASYLLLLGTGWASDALGNPLAQVRLLYSEVPYLVHSQGLFDQWVANAGYYEHAVTFTGMVYVDGELTMAPLATHAPEPEHFVPLALGLTALWWARRRNHEAAG